MENEDLDLAALILAARNGDESAVNRLLREYRPFLRLIAEQEVGPELQRREDASDIVQRTEIEAYQAIRQFQGSSEPEFSAWLKQILRRNVSNLIRDNRAAKRDVRRERYLDDTEGSVSVTWLIPAGRRHVSASSHVIKAEAALKLLRALHELPEEQCTAVRLRHLKGCSLNEIAATMHKSPAAVAGLIRRGVQALRDQVDVDGSWL
jgi:RNA polymerase sigma-70 factor (ECF subfamily)